MPASEFDIKHLLALRAPKKSTPQEARSKQNRWILAARCTRLLDRPQIPEVSQNRYNPRNRQVRLMSQTTLDDITVMKRVVAVAAFLFCLGPAIVRADDPLPMPRILDYDDVPKISSAEFARLLQQMKAEREALRSDWQSLVRKNSGPPRNVDQDLHVQLKQILDHLQRRGSGAPPASPPQTGPPDVPREVKDPPTGGSEKPPPAPEVEKHTGPASTSVDVVSQAQALFRARQYDEALSSFRLIDLKGQKAAVRAPVEYLMALCLLHLGKNEEALPLLREVANSRGDEKLAGHAQWHLEMLRWQRDIQDRLQEIRQRRASLEKR